MKIRISIITVCYNAEDSLRDTIQSVLEQTFEEYEYLIIDGKSSDKSMDIIQEYKNDKMKIYSEEDRGIYNAMNRGVARAKGEYLYFLNAGDTFFSKTVLEDVMKEIDRTTASLIYGNVCVLYERKHKRAKSDFGKPNKKSLKRIMMGDMPCHQSMFIRAEVIAAHYFNERYRIRADFDLFVYLFRYKFKMEYITLTIANYPADGVSSCKTQKLKDLYTEETETILYNYYPVYMRIRRVTDKLLEAIVERKTQKYL